MTPGDIMTPNETSAKQVALMTWLSSQIRHWGIGDHTYIVGGAVRNFVLGVPIKDIDIMIDSVALNGYDSARFATDLQKVIPTETNLTTNQYGVAILTMKGEWDLWGHSMKGEVIEIANARKESYGGAEGKGYKPHAVEMATAAEDVVRREFTFNTLMWRLSDLASGPASAPIIDLTGTGLADLKAGIMRCPADPNKTFSDDPTRMLRAIKFMNRYGFQFDDATSAAILQNASKMYEAPPDAIGALLTEQVLNDSDVVIPALRAMESYGLLSTINVMIADFKALNSRMQRWANELPLEVYFDMLPFGLRLGDRIEFLTQDERKRLSWLVPSLSVATQDKLLATLKQPGRVFENKEFIPNIIKDGGHEPQVVGKLLGQIVRETLLDNPTLVDTGNIHLIVGAKLLASLAGKRK